MAENPFRYGAPVEGEHFVGRRREVEQLQALVDHHLNAVLTSPRRFGKTSLLRVALPPRSRKRAVVAVNVLQCPTPALLAERLLRGTYAVPGGNWRQARQGFAAFLRALRVRPSVSFSGTDVTFSFEPGLSPQDLEHVVTDVYRVLAEVGRSRPVALVLDEFQSITDLSSHLPVMLKGLADAHPAVSLVVAGSRRHLMEELVLARAAPLYGMAEPFNLSGIPSDTMARFLVHRAHGAGKELTLENAHDLVGRVGPAPNDIQRLAYHAFNVAESAIGARAIDAGLDVAVTHDAGRYAELYEELPQRQRRVLSQIAASGRVARPQSVEFVRAADLPSPGAMQAALRTLVQKELVARRPERGCLVIADPFFAHWLRTATASP